MKHWGIALAGIVLLALVVRAAFWVEWRQAEAALPVIDALEYETDALALLRGESPPSVYWHAPLYPWFIAAVYAVGPWDPARVMLVQIALGLTTVLLTGLLARRLLSGRWWILPPLVVALYGPLVYFEGQLLRPTLFTTLLTSWLWVFVGIRSESRGRWLGAGALLGLCAVCRESALVLVPVAAAFAFGPARSLSRPALLLLGVALVVLPVTIRNVRVGGEWVLLSSSGGINFAIGNAPDSERLENVRPGRDWDALVSRARREGGALTPGERSAFYYAEGLAYWRSDPFGALRNTWRKTVGAFAAEELPRNQDVYEGRDASRVLRVLLWRTGWFAFPFGLIAPVALLALPRVLKASRTSRRLAVVLIVFMAGIIVFFPAARYRIAMVPVFALLFGVGLIVLRDALRTRRMAPFLAFALLAGFVNGGGVRAEPDPADAHFMRGWTWMQRNRPLDAEAAFERALEADPSHTEALTNLSALVGARGDVTRARSLALEAVRADSTNARAWRNVGAAEETRGRFGEAERAYRRALDAEPDDADAWAAYRRLLERRDAVGEGIPLLEAAVSRWPNDPGNWARLIRVWRELGAPARADSVLERARERHPHIERLLAPGASAVG